MTVRRILLGLGLCCGLALAGCAGMHQATQTGFQTQANRICTTMNTSPYLDTKPRFDQSLRRRKAGLDQLALQHPPAREQQTYRALLRHMQRIYVFDKEHESAEIRAARQAKLEMLRMKKGQRPTLRLEKRLLVVTNRQIGGDFKQKFREARTLGLTDCNIAVTTASLTEVVKG
jgi:hypothetical protein